MQHKLGNGPWVHVRFADARAQQQALGKNGAVLQGSMIGVIEGIHPASSASALGDASERRSSLEPAPAAGIPLRIQQARTVGPSLPRHLSRDELGKAGWWTRLAGTCSGGEHARECIVCIARHARIFPPARKISYLIVPAFPRARSNAERFVCRARVATRAPWPRPRIAAERRSTRVNRDHRESLPPRDSD